MKLVLSSLTHHDCPVEAREKVSFSESQRHSMLRKMHTDPAVSEAVILETCNRVEFYAYVKKSFDFDAYLLSLFNDINPASAKTWKKFNTTKTGMEVVGHLFSVAAGLDSQMIGENQILSQVKTAYSQSVEHRMSKIIFHRLFHKAFRVGKAVRTQTDINCGAVSVSLAAVEAAKNLCNGNFNTAMVIGAGENAELTAKYLLKSNIKQLYVANRNRAKAKKLCGRLGLADPISLNQVNKYIQDVNLIISSTGSDAPIMRFEDVHGILAFRETPLLIIDIAVPRDIDPEIKKFECVRLINIDQLNQRIDQNLEKRNRQIPRAKAIIDEAVMHFERWFTALDVVPAIMSLKQKGQQVAEAEALRYAKDFGPESADKLKSFAESLVNKMLHGPIRYLKSGGDTEPTDEQIRSVDLINKMFFEQDDPKQ